MGTVVWKGGASPIAQVDTLTVGGTVEADDEFTVTIGDKSLMVVGGNTNTTVVASAINTALNALNSSEYPEFAEITWTSSAAVVTATAKTKGVPFTVTATTTESGGGAADDQTFIRAASVVNSGPNDWSVADNWDTGSVPANTDDVIIENSNVDILYGLAQTGILANSLTIKQSFTGDIGLPLTNPGGYPEYRATILEIGANTVTIGEGLGYGSGRIRLDLDAQVAAITVHNTGQSQDAASKALLLTGTDTNTTLTVSKGSLAIAPEAGQTAIVTTLTASHRGNVLGDVDLRSGSGATVTTLSQKGGTLILGASPTTITQTAGQLTVQSGNTTAATIDGGTFRHEGSAAVITTLTAGAAAIVDFSTAPVARTVTNCVAYGGAAILDPLGLVTFTNGIDVTRAGLASASRSGAGNVTIDWGEHFTVTKSAI